MKKILCTIAVTLAAIGVSAQSTTAYFAESSTFRNQLNPAFAPLRGYLNLPVIGGINISAGGDLSVDKLLYPGQNGGLVTLLESSVSPDLALSKLSAENLLGIETRINILGFGAYTGNHKNFWSFDMILRTGAEVNFPYELFDFLKRGQSTSIQNMGITADSYLEAGFNYSFPVTDKLYVGARVKALVGLAYARLNIDRFDVDLNENSWSAKAQGTLDISAAGLEINTKLDEEGRESYNMNDIKMKPNSPAGYGLGFDLGAVYEVIPDLQVSLAVNDLGFIKWNKMQSGSVQDGITYDGVEVNAGGSTPDDFNLDDLEFRPTSEGKSARSLRASINAGVEYRLLNHRIGVGLLYTARFLDYKTRHNITAAVDFHPLRWFSATGTYQFIDNKAGAVGLALNFSPSWINFYVATDVLLTKKTTQFVPIKQSLMDFTVGLAIPLGRRGHRTDAWIKASDRK